jgi:hypothetical protein
MTIRTLGGWALLINALLTFCILIGVNASLGDAAFYLVAGEAASLLLVAGLLAIWTIQPQTGLVGQIGLWCLGIATAIAFVVRVVLLFGISDVGDFIPFSSALIGMVGSLLVGWVTIRAKVFHPAIGWLLIVSGVLNLIGGLLPGGTGAALVGIIAGLAEAVALGGFGWTMLRHATGAQSISLQQR